MNKLLEQVEVSLAKVGLSINAQKCSSLSVGEIVFNGEIIVCRHLGRERSWGIW